MAAANSYWNAKHNPGHYLDDLKDRLRLIIDQNRLPNGLIDSNLQAFKDLRFLGCKCNASCQWCKDFLDSENKKMDLTTPLSQLSQEEDTELRQSCFSDAEYNAKRGCSLKRKAETQLDPVDSEELEEESLADELGDLADALWDLFKPRIEELVRQTLPNPRPIKSTPMESYVFKPPRSTGKRML